MRHPFLSLSLSALMAILSGMPAGGMAGAQTPSPSPAEILSPGEATILDGLIAGALPGSPGSRALDSYLGAASLPREEVVRRASALIRAIGQRRATLPPGQVLGAVERVARVAERAISSISVHRLAVDDNYVPRKAAVALDFGPRDGSVMRGFERVVAGDPRLSGDGVNAIRRPDKNALLSDGLSGVRKIELDVPNGRYRVVMMTQNLNDVRLNRLPFGQAVLVNNVPFRITGRGVGSWGRQAILDNSDSAVDADGFPAAGSDGIATALFDRQQGGAIVLEGTSTDGKLRIELRGFGSDRSYITGLVVEPLAPGVNPRVAFETRILSAAAEAVAGIDPVAGNPLERPESQTSNGL